MEVDGLERFRTTPYRHKRLKDYCRNMSQDNGHVEIDWHVRAVLDAQGFSVEESPRSIYKVEKLYQALASYAPGKAHMVDLDYHVRNGINLAYRCFGRREDQDCLDILPLKPEVVHLITSNPKGSAGLTAMGQKKEQTEFAALESAFAILKKGKVPEPCLAFKRTQFHDKTRLVWGYPYSMTIAEGLLAKPLIEMFKRSSTPMMFAMSSMAIGFKLNVASHSRNYAYGLDYSKFDASLPRFLIHIAFKILRTWFDEEQIEPVTGLTVGLIFDKIENYFVYTPIVMPDGKVYYGKDHGVPSGSYFTQMIDSICNAIIAGSLSSRFDMKLDRRHLFVLGDDCVIWSNRLVNLQALSYYAYRKFGVTLHGPEKSELVLHDQPVPFLGRKWVKGYADLEQSEMLKRMIYSEQHRCYPKDPEQAERQAKLTILSILMTGLSGWRMAERIFEIDRTIDRSALRLERELYWSDSGQVDVPEQALSGLERYKRKYIYDGKTGRRPQIATALWV